MFSLTYVSSATQLFSDQDLVQLLQQCDEKNTRLGITGMLLYKDGNFIQVLEGSDENVKLVYRSILNDQRHHGVICLLEENIAERQFPGWSMGFRNLRDVDIKEVPAYSDFLNISLTSSILQSNPSRAQKLLSIFRLKIR
jgi:hypothetical protein